MKKCWKILIGVVCGILILAACYLMYVFIDYHRIGTDYITISGEVHERIPVEEEYKLVSYNIGFGAYEPDYGFFMDGGTQSWAWSEERLTDNIGNIATYLKDQEADFYLLQEVDRDSTRSYHVDEMVPLVNALGTHTANTWAQNYDSPFLFYPFTQPHGKSVSGLLTMSPFAIRYAKRVELPIEESLMRFLDLDRCYSKNRLPMFSGQELVLYNLHLSAYTSDGTIATEQLQIILDDMEKEYSMGNYCIAGGDFNKDLVVNSEELFGKPDKEYSWAQPIPEGMFDGYHVKLIAPLDENDPVPSCRNADGPYHEGQYVLTVDGFMVSPNVEVKTAKVLDTGFADSDHNPVELVFSLIK